LLLLEPSGILKSLLIDSGTLAVIHKEVTIPRKELRAELASHGVLVPDARLIASQVAEVREANPAAKEGHSSTAGKLDEPSSRKTSKASKSSKASKNNALWAKVQEEVKNSETPKLSPEQSREIVERFRKEIQKSSTEPKQEAVTEK
jgi:hypothetical protein